MTFTKTRIVTQDILRTLVQPKPCYGISMVVQSKVKYYCEI